LTSHAWDRPEEYDHLVVVANDEPPQRDAIRARLEAVPGRARAAALGRYPRFRLVLAGDGEEALRLVTPEVTVLAVDLVVPRRNGLDVIQDVRKRRPDLAILAFTAGAPPSEAIAAMMAGADHFLDYEGPDGVEPALELAIDRRRLSRFIERTEVELEQARSRLFQLGGALPPGLPGFRPPVTTEAVVPFNEAARLYLLSCAMLFTGDPRGLAQRLGISYFALRRLLKRYNVPFPGRSRTRASSER
jgi:DNA-binding NarL/FixJ family response regulator